MVAGLAGRALLRGGGLRARGAGADADADAGADL